MRAYAIHFAGLELYIYKLELGTLILNHERHGRKPKECTFNEEDFEDGANTLDHTAVAKLKSGILASAIGLELCLTKNEGVLKMVFEGKTGGTATWIFNGIEVMYGGRVTASACTQTDIDPSRCSSCGEENILRSVVVSREMQTDKENKNAQEKTQTNIGQLNYTGVQTDVSILRGHELSTRSHTLTGAVGGHMQTATSMQKDRKRKAQATEDIEPLLDKRAKSTHDSPPWPRHLYMTCRRITPTFKGDVGTLHIDVAKGTVWVEGWYDYNDMRVFEKKQLDLRDAATRVAYHPHNRISVSAATHHLTLSRPHDFLDPITILRAACAVLGWKIWSSSSAYDTIQNKIDPEDGEAVTQMTDPTIIVDALVHCIDRTSGRGPIHDPDAAFELARDRSSTNRANKMSLSDDEDSDIECCDQLEAWGKLREGLRMIIP